MMPVLKEDLVFDGKYIRVVDRHFRCRSGAIGHWETVQRKTHGRIVAVVPITDSGQVILTRIYRVPRKRWIIEFCAGLADKRNESEVALARRECLEETGYKVRRMKLIMRGPFNAGLLADEMSVYLGYGACKVQKQQLEDSEAIEVLRVPIWKLRWLLSHPPRNTDVDIKLYGLIPFLTQGDHR